MYVFASPDYSFLSSTGVKEMATFGGDVSDLVPASVSPRRSPSAHGAPSAQIRSGQELAGGCRKPSSAALISAAA